MAYCDQKAADVQVLQIALEEHGLEFTPDGLYIRWARTNPKHPRNWGKLRKAYDIGLIILLEFYTTTINASGATAAKDARHEFGIDLTLAVFLFVSTYCLAQAVGNVIFPPYSESFGRKKLYIISTVLFSVFSLITAKVPTLGAAVAGRTMTGFLSAIPTVIITGSIEDMFNARERIWLVFAYMVVANFAVAMGPVMSGYITAQLGWRWVFYVSSIVTGCLGLLMLGIRESRPSLLLSWEVDKLRQVTGNMSLQAQNPDEVPDLSSFVRDGLLRPVRLFFTEPIVFACSVMSGCSVAVMYLFTESLPPIYESMGFSTRDASLPFFAIGLGFLPSIVVRFMDQRVAAQRQRDRLPLLPEHKLAGISLGAPFLAVGLWWFAWMVPPAVHGVHWFVTIIPLFFVGFALNEFGTVLAGYLADSYNSYAASAFAAMSFARSTLSSLFPLIAPEMFGALGANVALSVLASGAVVFCPMPFIFRYYGRRLREKSKFAKYSLQLSDLEKVASSHEPHKVTIAQFEDPDEGLSDEERAKIDRALLWKLDLKLVPWLSLLYLISFLDRTNIGNAKLANLQEDLDMTDGQYNAALTIFFVSYSVFEPLTNVLLKRLRPSVFIPIIMVLWGICMLCMGFVHNWAGLMAVRWFLGLTEAGLFPGVNYFLSCWYKRSELGVRMAIFFSAAALAGSFGGLLAAAIANMDGIGGKAGWAWIFILEGLATIVVGVISFWMVYDFPDEAKFLSDDDRKRVLRRLSADQQASAEHEQFKMAYFWNSLKDWKTYTGMMIYMGADGSLYAFSLFVPTIINELGYEDIHAQLLSVPPYAAAAIITVAVGFMADRTRQRGLWNMLVSILGITGFAMLLGAKGAGARYAGTFLGAMGIYPAISNTISWTSNNVEGVYKRGVTLGFVIGWGNLNGIVSSNIYRGADAPRFYPGHGTVLAYLILFQLGGSILQYILLRRENAKRERGERDDWVEGLDQNEISLLGDKRPDFIYTL
ncbi:major facilitator superfamily domain-containing protein [Aspergillus granulosus]|uniref:Major facilitator superfamily domain-containing protein n=1 Tax=Aspergillus granulosus TaxID=176169 RepID=A0ABR4GSH2_9EURO